MYYYYVTYACVVRREDLGLEVSFLSDSNVSQSVLEKAARTLAVLGREGGYWIVHEAWSGKTWIRPCRPYRSPRRRFFTDPATGRVLDGD
jgi:hypothetical protein